MSIYEFILLTFALGVMFIAFAAGHHRGAAWVLVIAADVVLSDLYVAAGLPYPEAAMALLDFGVCLAIFVAGLYRWELWLFILMQFSMLVSIVDLAAGIGSPGWIERETYLLVLELINYAVLILIGGVSGFVVAGRLSGGAFRPWPLFLAPLRPLQREGAKHRP